MRRLQDWVHRHKPVVIRVYGVGHCIYFGQMGAYYIHASVVLGGTCFTLALLGVVVVIFFEGE